MSLFLLLACTVAAPGLPTLPAPLPDLPPAPQSPPLTGAEPGAMITEEIRALFHLPAPGSAPGSAPGVQ